MSNLTVFNFESHEVRFVGTANNPWWVASDVCGVLEIKNNRDAIARLDDDEKDVAITDTPGGKQEMIVINESGLYSLVLTSRKPQAKRFKKWITSEVIPTIRKTGKYELPLAEPTLLPAPTLEEISNLLDLTLGKAGLDSRLVAGAKLNAIAKRFPHLLQETEEAKSLLVIPLEDRLLNPTQVGEILQERNGEKWSPRRVNKVLIEKGLQTRNDGGDPDYLPTENGKQYGIVTANTAIGHGRTVQQMRWYPSVVEVFETIESSN